ncbi:MAG: hypothetical protein LBF38_06990, partial [Deltaproteobacteria bacterium]|nr:hypothetical protein [Deltaproteobacteria bacterium]
MGNLDQELALVYQRHYNKEKNKLRASNRQLTFLKFRNLTAENSLQYGKEEQINSLTYIYEHRINYLRKMLNPPPNYMLNWL